MFVEDPILTQFMELGEVPLFDPTQKTTFDFIAKNYLSLSKNEDINDMINLEIIQYINDNKENK
jgi:hypothetical protein